MAVTVQRQFESAVTEMSQDAFVGSAIENGATMITFDLRQRDFQPEGGAPSPLSWRKEASHVAMHELSTFHNPIKYRFLLTPGYYRCSGLLLEIYATFWRANLLSSQ
jgi:hypothetical protein